MHVFPDGKKYVGCTGRSLKSRWNGGFGYGESTFVFKAILKFGWNNVRHYLLMDNLTKEEAYLYEASFIRGWKTYTKSKGYNTAVPRINSADIINVPCFRKCAKVTVKDICNEENTMEKYNNMFVDPRRNSKRVRCIETNEIFKNASAASTRYSTGNAQVIRQAILTGHASGTCWIQDIECGIMEVPAHWEYIN